MRLIHLLGGVALTAVSALAIAQDAPESLLPKAFQDPAPASTRAPRPAPKPAPRVAPTPRPAAPATAEPRPATTPAVLSTPSGGPSTGASPSAAPSDAPNLQDVSEQPEQPRSALTRIPSLEELQGMSADDFETLLGANLIVDTPPSARRSAAAAGLLDESEGGLRSDSLAGQNAALVRTAILANRGALVSRWGHILLRRALVSRLQAPAGMNPADFLAMRVALLLRMGEPEAARALLQQLDIADYDPFVGTAVLDVYARTADFTGICPIMASQPNLRADPAWTVSHTICSAFRGDSTAALTQLDHDIYRGTMPKIDLLLAQKYAGAAGTSRKAVTIEWKDVPDLSTWRYGLALGVGLEPPADLVSQGGRQLASMTVLAPSASLQRRASMADQAAAEGVLSGSAMVDLYSQLYADADTSSEWEDRADSLRDAYTLQDPKDRLSAMRALWKGADGQVLYGRQVLTAAACARMSPSTDLADAAADIIASMLSAGYDANAQRWSQVVAAGSQGWALIALAAPQTGMVDTGSIDTYAGADTSDGKHKSALLVAGLAGLERLSSGEASRYSNSMGLGLDSSSRFLFALDHAAQRGDVASVVLLAGLGMQGDGWNGMTPRYLYHIVSALRQVGLESDARMIAAEAVARA